MDLLEELKSLGVDVEAGVQRLGGNKNLYTRLMGSFVKTINEYYVSTDFDGNAYKEATDRAHAIKGASGNLSITPIFEAYTQIVDLLRKDKPEEAREKLKEIMPTQEKIISCINKYM